MNDFTKDELEYLGGTIYERPDTAREEMVRMRNKIQSMIDNYQDPSVDYGHLTDKHIGQWAGYLIEEYPRRIELEKILLDNPEIEEVFLEMYKKGFQDCKTEGGWN